MNSLQGTFFIAKQCRLCVKNLDLTHHSLLHFFDAASGNHEASDFVCGDHGNSPPLSASIMPADKIRPAALKVGIRLEPGQGFGFLNFRHSLATFLVSPGKDVKTIQELLRHAKVSTTHDLYSQAINAAKLEAQEEIALANTSVVATK